MSSDGATTSVRDQVEAGPTEWEKGCCLFLPTSVCDSKGRCSVAHGTRPVPNEPRFPLPETNGMLGPRSAAPAARPQTLRTPPSQDIHSPTNVGLSVTDTRNVCMLHARGGGGGRASVSDCLPLAAPIGLSPLHILTLCGPERVLVVGGGGAGPSETQFRFRLNG